MVRTTYGTGIFHHSETGRACYKWNTPVWLIIDIITRTKNAEPALYGTLLQRILILANNRDYKTDKKCWRNYTSMFSQYHKAGISQ